MATQETAPVRLLSDDGALDNAIERIVAAERLLGRVHDRALSVDERFAALVSPLTDQIADRPLAEVEAILRRAYAGVQIGQRSDVIVSSLVSEVRHG